MEAFLPRIVVGAMMIAGFLREFLETPIACGDVSKKTKTHETLSGSTAAPVSVHDTWHIFEQATICTVHLPTCTTDKNIIQCTMIARVCRGGSADEWIADEMSFERSRAKKSTSVKVVKTARGTRFGDRRFILRGAFSCLA